jgi:hypothetical protein
VVDTGVGEQVEASVSPPAGSPRQLKKHNWLFYISARDGLMAEDREIAAVLPKSASPAAGRQQDRRNGSRTATSISPALNGRAPGYFRQHRELDA